MNFIVKRIRTNPWPAFLIVFLLGALSYRLYSTYLSDRELVIRSGKWAKLMLVLSEIDKNYVDNLDYGDITEKSLPYILEKLDPHSVYLAPQELKSADEQLQGNFDGIGIQFNVPNDTAVVINVIAGGPSERAGIMSGDRLVRVNNEVVAGVKMNQDSLVTRLRGKSGTMVKVDVKRVGVDGLISFDIKRDKIPVKSVDVAYMIDDTLGYIKLSKFSRTSHKEFTEAVTGLRKSGLKSLIFDLRGNSGGYLDQALLLSNEFLDAGSLIVYMQGKNRPRQDFYADNNGKCRDLSVTVIIDEGSASSSEIFAGAIQDNDRGVIVGRRSYGKGLVQEPIYFSDNSGIRLTVARFYTPTGRSIQRPYDKNYREDILERYRHGEMMSADSIRFNDSLVYKTPSGKTVYGGGGITPDIFVPLDTSGVTNFFIIASNLGLTFRFSAKLADQYRTSLNNISSMEELNRFFNLVEFDNSFLQFAAENGLRPQKGEWEESRAIINNHIRAFLGRYSSLDDNAFYPILLEMDRMVKAAIER